MARAPTPRERIFANLPNALILTLVVAVVAALWAFSAAFGYTAITRSVSSAHPSRWGVADASIVVITLTFLGILWIVFGLGIYEAFKALRANATEVLESTQEIREERRAAEAIAREHERLERERGGLLSVSAPIEGGQLTESRVEEGALEEVEARRS